MNAATESGFDGCVRHSTDAKAVVGAVVSTDDPIFVSEKLVKSGMGRGASLQEGR